MTADRLFPSPGHDLAAGLEKLAGALARAHPLKPKHRAALPRGIRRLSDWLTSERDDLPRDYMNRPESLAAYLHYFLPWNIYRQGRLLQGLPLTLPADARIVDLGAGPLTFLMALGLGRPDLRRRGLRYTGVDRSGPALRAGERLWPLVLPDTPWEIRTGSRVAGGPASPPADLLVLANLLNEIEPPRGRGGSGGDGHADEPLLARWEGMLAAGGAVLIVEPGTRPAGRRLAALRQNALHRGWTVSAPCPHEADCPQPGTGHKPWCHFTFGPEAAPGWLVELGRRAQLPKDRVSLAFLLMRPQREGTASGPAVGDDQVRVVSETFALDDGGRGRYGCSARGLVLLAAPSGPEAAGPVPGDLLRVSWPSRPERDRKSGAWIVPRRRSDELRPPGHRGRKRKP